MSKSTKSTTPIDGNTSSDDESFASNQTTPDPTQTTTNTNKTIESGSTTNNCSLLEINRLKEQLEANKHELVAAKAQIEKNETTNRSCFITF